MVYLITESISLIKAKISKIMVGFGDEKKNTDRGTPQLVDYNPIIMIKGLIHVIKSDLNLSLLPVLL